MQLSIEIEREDDGRWIAEVMELPGVMTYGATPELAVANAEKPAIEVISDRIAHEGSQRTALNVSFKVFREQLAIE